LRIVRPNYEINKVEVFANAQKPIEKPIVSQEKIIEKEKFTKPNDKLSKTLEKLHNLSKEYTEKEKNIKDFSDFEKYRVFDDDDEETANNKQKEQIETHKEPEKSKVYGVSTKPLPRNLKEKDVETKKGNEDVSWVPPKNQKGDGSTKLNERFGY